MRVRSIPVNKRGSNEEVARIPLPKAGDELPLILASLFRQQLPVWMEQKTVLLPAEYVL